ncbi:major facilitator superfamily domain-containing protein [Sporodiniella umbellata]|nr:major facilitator superfamily domain-containing protein [Sporodiniella umbellata]
MGTEDIPHDDSFEKSLEGKSYGVQKVMLMKKLGRKWDKVAVIAGIVLIAWAKNWEGNVVYSSSTYIFSEFNALNLISLINVVLYIVETVLLPFYAKMADTVGRTESFAISIFFYILSGIIQATAYKVDTLIGGQVIYALGVTGVGILGHVLIADITTAANRGLFQAFYDLPAIINIFVATIVGNELKNLNAWRWAYSMISFCIAATAIPLIVGLVRLERTIAKSPLMPKRSSGEKEGSLWSKIKWFFLEMDIIGSLLFVGALCMILLPLVLATSYWGGWQSSTTIGSLVGGVVCAAIFCIWEWKIATRPVIPLGRWDSWTPIAGVLCCATVSVFHAANWTYHITYLQVSRRASLVDANYIDRSYDAIFLVAQILSGFLMKRFKVYRPIVFVGLSLLMIGIGLMIPSRYPDSPLGFVIITQLIAGCGAGFIYVPILVAVQSSVPAPDLAIVTALFQIGGTIATSIGSSIAGAIWNGMLPGELAQHVPGKYDPVSILGDLSYINALPEDQHAGTVTAYANVQKILSIASLGIAVLAFIFFLGMRGFSLAEKDEERTDIPLEEHNSTEAITEKS